MSKFFIDRPIVAMVVASEAQGRHREVGSGSNIGAEGPRKLGPAISWTGFRCLWIVCPHPRWLPSRMWTREP
jgi:hypothetical protein